MSRLAGVGIFFIIDSRLRENDARERHIETLSVSTVFVHIAHNSRLITLSSFVSFY